MNNDSYERVRAGRARTGGGGPANRTDWAQPRGNHGPRRKEGGGAAGFCSIRRIGARGAGRMFSRPFPPGPRDKSRALRGAPDRRRRPPLPGRAIAREARLTETSNDRPPAARGDAPRRGGGAEFCGRPDKLDGGPKGVGRLFQGEMLTAAQGPTTGARGVPPGRHRFGRSAFAFAF